MNTKPKLKSSESNTCNKCTQQSAKVHELSAKLIKQQTELDEFFTILNDVVFLLLPKTAISKFRKIFVGFNSTHELQIPISEAVADGRGYAWTPERRAKFGAAVSAAAAERQKNEQFYVYHYKCKKDSSVFMDSPYKTKTVTGYKELAVYLSIPAKTKYLKDRMWLKPDGQTFKLAHNEKVIISLNKPIVEKTLQQRREEFEQTYYKKHGIWPNEDQIPNNLLHERPQTDAAGRKIRHF